MHYDSSRPQCSAYCRVEEGGGKCWHEVSLLERLESVPESVLILKCIIFRPIETHTQSLHRVESVESVESVFLQFDTTGVFFFLEKGPCLLRGRPKHPLHALHALHTLQTLPRALRQPPKG